MIDFDKLSAIAEALSQYRDSGDILFDTRDRGNYGAWDWDRTAEMLRRADPTGLATGMLLSEMLEATVNGSQVRLSRVLREAGFVEQLQRILQVKGDLDAMVAAPSTALLDRLEASLQAISADFGRPSSREASICLRDAIYAMEKGLTLRWLHFDAKAPDAGPLRLNPEIPWYSDIAEFTRALRQELPLGAHLARIGAAHTAIGIRQIGKIAFLSSLTINAQLGTMDEQRAHGHHLAENLDLDTVVERYPNWTPPYRREHEYLDAAARAALAAQHPLDRIVKLPRDRLIWLAMILEITAQRMARTQAETVQLTESLGLALPAPQRSAAGLPVVFQPNWEAADLTLDAMVESLGLAPWEKAFLRPALAGMAAATFLPLAPLRIRLDTLEVFEWSQATEAATHYHDAQVVKDTSVALQPASAEWVGTRDEIDAARQALFKANLVKWLLAWGNRKFEKEWDAQMGWLEAALRRRLPDAFASRCASRQDPGFFIPHIVNIYSQSPKHKGYRPCCVFGPKSEVTDVARFFPRSSTDLVEMLGLDGESGLPEFLQGWNREQSPTTSPLWCFRPGSSLAGRRHYLEATVHFNRKNCPAEFALLGVLARPD